MDVAGSGVLKLSTTESLSCFGDIFDFLLFLFKLLVDDFEDVELKEVTE